MIDPESHWIQDPIPDLQRLSVDGLKSISQEIREYIIETILHNGGHFAANLGVVELTVGLHHVLNLPQDQLIWDVGHQAYPHKYLSGRKTALQHIRNWEGISGFPKRSESPYDAFGTGHSSTALSAALGMAIANQLLGDPERVHVAVVGDGALTGGMTWEALNNLGSHNPNLWVILNDNQMGIDPNTGRIDHVLQHNPKQMETLFAWFGMQYQGPIDGHDLEALVPVLKAMYAQKGPRLLHVRTVKGKGFLPAEQEQTRWHSTAKYTKINPQSTPHIPHKWQDVFGKTILTLARENPKLVGITPAMPSSCGMQWAMEAYPDRFLDVGIAEQHAITLAAGMATQGLDVVVNVYSSFLQRGYDPWIHDVVLQGLPVVLCIDRAGLVGEDGPTHHGAFDMAFLRCLPQLTLAAPRNECELACLMSMAIQHQGPMAIRYPKGYGFVPDWENRPVALTFGKGICLKKGKGVAVLGTGLGSQLAETGLSGLDEVGLYHFPFVKPLDLDLLQDIAQTYQAVVTVEDGCITGGWGESVGKALAQTHPHLTCINLGIPDRFVPHGSNEMLYESCGYGPMAIRDQVLAWIQRLDS